MQTDVHCFASPSTPAFPSVLITVMMVESSNHDYIPQERFCLRIIALRCFTSCCCSSPSPLVPVVPFKWQRRACCDDVLCFFLPIHVIILGVFVGHHANNEHGKRKPVSPVKPSQATPRHATFLQVDNGRCEQHRLCHRSQPMHVERRPSRGTPGSSTGKHVDAATRRHGLNAAAKL